MRLFFLEKVVDRNGAWDLAFERGSGDNYIWMVLENILQMAVQIFSAVELKGAIRTASQ